MPEALFDPYSGASGDMVLGALVDLGLSIDTLRSHLQMVLPAGWYLTNCSIPATVSMTVDGRVRLDFVNPRNDNIEVLVTARRRS